MLTAGPPPSIPPEMLAALDAFAGRVREPIVAGWFTHKSGFLENRFKLAGVRMSGRCVRYVALRDGRFVEATYAPREAASTSDLLFDAPELTYDDAVIAYLTYARHGTKWSAVRRDAWIRSADGVRPLELEP